MKTSTQFLATLVLAALVGFLAIGCGKSAGSGAKAFNSANAEIKAIWDKGMAAATAKDYATALLTFRQLSARTDLTPDQVKAVEQTATAVNDQMYEAANKGDAEALKAIEVMRKARYR
ncbi:MAG TPA: hypothetical protein VI136_25390 [Verrucomicrobiae bacterium]